MKLVNRAALIAAIGLTLGLTNVVAQHPESRPPRSALILVDVDFAGGSYAKFVKAVHKAVGGDFSLNILVPAEAEQVQLPALKLRGVGVETALEAAADMTTPLKSINVSTRRRAGAPVHTIRVRLPRKGKANTGPEMMVVKVYSLRAITSDPDKTGRMSHTTALTAIETGLSLVDGPPAEMKYHADSALLFVRGTVPQQHLIESMIARLDFDVARQVKKEVRNANQKRALEQGKSQKRKSEKAAGNAPRDH